MSLLTPYYGFDLGVKRGAICRLLPFSDTSPPVVNFLPWPKKELEGTPIKDSDGLVRVHSEGILEPWLASTPAQGPGFPGICFGDWTPAESYWGNSARGPLAVKSFLAGLYTGGLSPSVLVTWVSPSTVRAAFGLKTNCPKEKVWDAMAEAIRPLGHEMYFPDEFSEHEKDALVLAVLAASHYGDLPWTTRRLRVSFT